MNKDVSHLGCTFCDKELTVCVLKNICIGENFYNVYECTECAIGMTYPFPSEEKLAKLYSSGNYRTRKGKRFGLLIESLIHLGRIRKRSKISQFTKPGKILDIGCGRGLFLNVMRKGGWSTIGTELNKETASYATEVYGLKILPGDIIHHQLPSESLNAININQVLEHLKNPHEVISECYRLLRKKGVLIISVPDIRSLQFIIGKENWFLLDLPYHLFHFSEAGLSKLLQKNKFKVKRIKRFSLEYTPFGWLQTLLNISGIRFNLLYDLLKTSELKGGEIKSIKLPGIFGTLLLLPIYFPIALTLSALEPLILKSGGSIEVYAVKE